MRRGKKRMLTVSDGWAKHLRPFYKKLFWSSERQAGKKMIDREIKQNFK